MDINIKKLIVQSLNLNRLDIRELVQELWGGYGEIIRAKLIYPTYTVDAIVKHIAPNRHKKHPRGWDTKQSHERKVTSYQIESTWYKNYSKLCVDTCRIPELIEVIQIDDECILILEDLNTTGYSERKSQLSVEQAQRCIEWLANFHAKFMGVQAKDLWAKGSYWHLDTRQDEWNAMADGPLKRNARKIDATLDACTHKTILHGDAKVANFCFNPKNSTVAAVDFQYVGGGCGMKDLTYFMGSCLSSDDCFNYESTILRHYFKTLEAALSNTPYSNKFNQLESEWRKMYPLAWADFTRFLLGWMPEHQKINAYSIEMTDRAITSLK